MGWRFISLLGIFTLLVVKSLSKSDDEVRAYFHMISEWRGDAMGQWMVPYRETYTLYRLEVKLCRCGCPFQDYLNLEVVIERQNSDPSNCILQANTTRYLEEASLSFLCEDRESSRGTGFARAVVKLRDSSFRQDYISGITVELSPIANDLKVVDMVVGSYPEGFFPENLGDEDNNVLANTLLTSRPSTLIIDQSPWTAEDPLGAIIVFLPGSFRIVKVAVYCDLLEEGNRPRMTEFTLTTHHQDQRYFTEDWINTRTFPTGLKEVSFQLISKITLGDAREVAFWGGIEEANIVVIRGTTKLLEVMEIYKLQVIVLEDQELAAFDVSINNSPARKGPESKPNDLQTKVDITSSYNTWVIDFARPVYIDRIQISLMNGVSLDNSAFLLFFFSNDTRFSVDQGSVEVPSMLNSDFDIELNKLAYILDTENIISGGEKSIKFLGIHTRNRFLIIRSPNAPLRPEEFFHLEAHIIENKGDEWHHVQSVVISPNDLLTTTTTRTPTTISTDKEQEIQFHEIPHFNDRAKYVKINNGEYVIDQNLEVYLSPTTDPSGMESWVRCILPAGSGADNNGDVTLECDNEVSGSQYLVFRKSELENFPTMSAEVTLLNERMNLIKNISVVISQSAPTPTDDEMTTQMVELPFINGNVKFIKANIGNFIMEHEVFIYLSPTKSATKRDNWVQCKVPSGSVPDNNGEVTLECEEEVTGSNYLVFQFSNFKEIPSIDFQFELLGNRKEILITVMVSITSSFTPQAEPVQPPSSNEEIQFFKLPYFQENAKYVHTNIGSFLVDHGITIYLSTNDDINRYDEWMQCKIPAGAVLNYNGEITLECPQEVSGDLFIVFRYSKQEDVPTLDFQVSILTAAFKPIVEITVELVKEEDKVPESNVWATLKLPNRLNFNQIDLLVEDMKENNQNSVFNVFTSPQQISTLDQISPEAEPCKFVEQRQSKTSNNDAGPNDKTFSYVCNDESLTSASFVYISLNAEFFLDYKSIVLSVHLHSYRIEQPIYSAKLNISIVVQGGRPSTSQNKVGDISYVTFQINGPSNQLTRVEAVQTSGEVDPSYFMVYVSADKKSEMELKSVMQSITFNGNSNRKSPTINALGTECLLQNGLQNQQTNVASFDCSQNNFERVAQVIFVFNSTQFSEDYLPKHEMDSSGSQNFQVKAVFDLNGFDKDRKLFTIRYTMMQQYIRQSSSSEGGWTHVSDDKDRFDDGGYVGEDVMQGMGGFSGGIVTPRGSYDGSSYGGSSYGGGSNSGGRYGGSGSSRYGGRGNGGGSSYGGSGDGRRGHGGGGRNGGSGDDGSSYGRRGNGGGGSYGGSGDGGSSYGGSSNSGGSYSSSGSSRHGRRGNGGGSSYGGSSYGRRGNGGGSSYGGSDDGGSSYGGGDGGGSYGGGYGNNG